MSLKEKALHVDLSDLTPGTAAIRPVSVPRTAIGLHAQQLHQDEQIRKENSTLKAQLAQYDGSLPSRKLDPRNVVHSKLANRVEESFVGAEFEALKQEIAESGGNIQAIKVRPIGDGRFEVVFGHRRHRACLEQGLPVLALIEDMDDQALFQQMEQENRQRSDPRPYERGLFYSKALAQGVYASIRQLAQAVQIDATGLSRYLMLAKLPDDVLSAFSSPLVLQHDWASPLTDALSKNPDAVKDEARKISAERATGVKLTDKAIFARLVSIGTQVGRKTPEHIEIKGAAGGLVSITFDTRGGAKINIKRLPIEKQDQIAFFFEKLLKEESQA